MLKILIAAIALLIAPAYAHEEHHPTKSDEPPIRYTDWKNKKDQGCCDSTDCRPISDEHVQESPAFKVFVENKWCPVLPHHFLKQGNAPDWSRNHVCVRPDSSHYDTDMGGMGMTRAPTPTDPCARLLCFQPRPQI